MSRRVEELLLPGPGGIERFAAPYRALVAGGGIAGVAAATVLAERGASVVLVESANALGGRAGAWTETLSDGTPFEMERGFHAFFRQYHNLRALLRRVDPELAFLKALDDYPVLAPEGEESFAGLPHRAPWNVLALTRRARSLRIRDLMRVDGRAALEMLRFDPERTYARFDRVSARAYLDSLRFPLAARRMLFDVFSHSFFNPEEEMSAAELLAMFHFYFVGNPEGLVFDVCSRPFSHAIWRPFEERLTEQGVVLRLGERAHAVERRGARYRVELDGGALDVDGVVLALPVDPLRALVSRSRSLDDACWRARVDSLELTAPFAVWRLWLDRPVRAGRAAFAGTAGVGRLDNVSLYHLFQDESRARVELRGGAVVELHAYGLPSGIEEAELRRDLLDALHRFYPETRGARALEERFLLRRDCPAFRVGSHALRPGVATPFAGLALAGDFVKLPIPSALMERAAAAGFLAANELCATRGVRPEPIRSIPRRGLLAGKRSKRELATAGA